MGSAWKLPKTLEEAQQVQVFSGGACNIRDAKGQLLRNEERDSINDWLTEQGITFYDPQIHPDTHGREYDFAIDYPMEAAARAAADIHLYEVSPLTMGGATAMEIGLNERQNNAATIIFFSDGRYYKDMLPPHSREGYPLFEPHGLRHGKDTMQAHYREMVKTGNLMRKYCFKFAEQLSSLTVAFSNQTFHGDVVITPERLHAVDMFRAVVKAASGHRVIVNFTGTEQDGMVDEKGYPLYRAHKNPSETKIRAMLDEYGDEGNALRVAICDLVRINVFNRVVFTQEAAINAFKDLINIRSLKSHHRR